MAIRKSSRSRAGYSLNVVARCLASARIFLNLGSSDKDFRSESVAMRKSSPRLNPCSTA